jgi:hypothetical protein
MRVLNQQWSDSLLSQQYPFMGSEPAVSTDLFVLPDDCFLDLNLLVAQSTNYVYLSSITTGGSNGAALVTFTLQDGTVVGTADFSTISNGQVNILNGTAIAGIALVDPGNAIIVNGWTPGVHTFQNVQVIPHLLVVSDPLWNIGFQLPDGSIFNASTGVTMVADTGLWLSASGSQVRLDAIGDPFNGRTVPTRGLQTINGVAPDPNGNINLTMPFQTNLSDPTLTKFRVTVYPSGQDQLTIQLVEGSV